MGCERLQPSFANGCLLEVSGIDSLVVFKEMAGAGIGRMIIKRAWELYAEWLKEVELITAPKVEKAILPPPAVEKNPAAVTSERIANA